jgi:hypothetical protein
MPVNGRPQVVHDPLADGVREQRLAHAERPGRHRDGDHPPYEGDEEGDVAGRDGLVEHGAEEEGRHHPEPR